MDSYRYYINNQTDFYTYLGGDKKYGEDKLPHIIVKHMTKHVFNFG